jgi:uncharacterized alpha-E superfamily protein
MRYRVVRKNELPSVSDNDLPTAVMVIDERIGRSAIPMGTEWPAKFVEVDAEEMRHESERRYLASRGTAFVLIEDVPDPDSLIDAAEQMEARDEEIREQLAQDRWEMTTGTIRCLPPKIQGIINRFSLPSHKWEELSVKERIQRKRAIQKGIELYYLKQGHS